MQHIKGTKQIRLPHCSLYPMPRTLLKVLMQGKEVIIDFRILPIVQMMERAEKAT
jgi:hypothetical protein